MKKYHLISLGCPKNLVDSEKFASIIEVNGYEYTSDIEKSDVIIVNTCGFILDAKEESIDTILQAAEYKNIGKCKKLIVTGCLVKRYLPELKKALPEVDNFINLKDFKAFANLFYGKYREERKLLTPKHFAYLRIADGCDNRCSYCAIPDIRGHFKSEPMEKIIKEAKRLADYGIKELIITAQDTTLYGIDLYKKPMLSELLKKLNEIKKIKWIRLLYLHPAHLKTDMIQTIANLDKVCNYFDIPLQHINNEILKSMNRNTTKEKIKNILEEIKEYAPDSVIRTTFIVGYPGETKEAFEELKEFIIKQKFAKLGVFTYSQEEGTPAYKFGNTVDESIKQNRKDELMSIQQEISAENMQKYIGRTLEVIIDNFNKEFNAFEGRTVFDAPEIDGKVFIFEKDLKIGDIYKVKITDSWEYDLTGETI